MKFVTFGIKINLVKIFKYFLNMLAMFGHVIRVDEYIIQIDHNTNIQKIRKEVVHELLKGYRSIDKTKKYYRLLK